MIVEEIKQEHSASASTSTSTSTSNPVAANPIRQPTAFAAPNPATSSGPTFYRTPVHAALSVEGTSMFCVEGYVNTPELSAGRGGGLNQGLPANGPYRSLFRARSESRGSNKATTTAATAIAPDAALHVLAEAAQSPEALSPVSTASPAPVSAPAAKKRRKPSPLAASSPASSVVPLDYISASSPAASVNASPSYVTDCSTRQPSQAKLRGSGIGKGKHKEKAPPPAAAAPRRSSAQVAGGNDGKRYERQPVSRQQLGPAFPSTQSRETDSAVQTRPRNVQKNRAGLEVEVASVSPPPAPAPAPADEGSYENSGDYYSSCYETELPDASNAARTVTNGGQSLSPSPPNTWESPRSSPPVLNHYSASARTTSNEPSPALQAESHSVTPGTKPRMLTLLIEDRRHGTDELAEVHVPLKTGGEGHFWADAQDVCAALQSGPSRIDGGALRTPPRSK
jgi:hypothetical protein